MIANANEEKNVIYLTQESKVNNLYIIYIYHKFEDSNYFWT